VGKTCIIFIDDLNMPMKEKYGAQPPIEILRQAIDRKEWHDTKNCELKKLEELLFIGAMGHPGGGKTYLSERFMRHFTLINLTEFSQSTLEHIFRTILSLGLFDYSVSVLNVVDTLTCATIAVYQKVLMTLPPTPAKSHYAFNLRDLANIFKGLISVPNYKMNRAEMTYKLWVHECCRVFADRLVDEGDREAFRSILHEQLRKWIHLDLREVTGGKELLFCHFVDEKVYQECTDLEKLRETLEMALEEHNLRAEKKMDLVLFDFAIHHISRISRILCASPGNALLIGVGGSGRQSLTRLAAFLQNYEIFQLEMTKKYEILEWKDDLKGVLLKAGIESRVIVFILRDSDLKYEVFLEHINSLLNTGEIPNLHAPEEKDIILENLRDKRGFSIKTEEEKWEGFIENCRSNIHMAICMSPIGTGIRERLRQFPSLVNCCTIDWFTAWPQEALQSVAKRYIIEQGLVSKDQLIDTAVDICVSFHLSISELTQRVLAEKRRYSYVTPTNYLQLLQSFKEIQAFKQDTTGKLREKYATGVKKLDYTQEFVMQLRNELLISKPILEEKTRKTEEIMMQITKDTAEADKTRNVVAAEQQESAKQAEAAEIIKAECQKELEQAIPELEAAIQSLKTVKKQDLDLIKSMQRPPMPIRLALEGVAIIYGEKPVPVQDPNDRTIVTLDYFLAGKKMMNNPKFLKNLSKFDKNNITEEIIEQLAPYMENPIFQPSVVRNASSAAEGLCKWIRAMYNFYIVNQRVIPKQEALEKAKTELSDKFKLLQTKQMELELVEQKIQELKKRFDEENFEKQKLMAEIQACEIKLERALRLTEKLSGEKKRWEEQVAKLDIDMINLLGDILLSAGVVSYMGPFFGSYREATVANQWIPKINALKLISCSQDFTLKAILGDPLLIQKWIMNGLPSDKVSVDNAIIITRSSRWPLIIDPQKQANKWLKKMIPANDQRMVVAKQQSEDFLNILENAIFVGNVMLLEGVGEVVDPRLDPVLLKQIVEKEGVKVIKLGDMFKQYDERFAFYMTSTLPNPHYTSEISTKVTILNFTITEEGLAEQLLAIVCTNEIRKETEERIRLVSQTSQYQKKMQEFEDKILEMLKSAGNDMLEDEQLINSLTESKRMSEEVEKKLQTARITEQRILELQEHYIPIAKKGAVLYFCVVDLSNLEPMYQYSIEWFYICSSGPLTWRRKAEN
jgi:dynein heavy chain